MKKLYPEITLGVFDLPSVIEETKIKISHLNDVSRINLIAGDFIKNELAEHCQNGQYIHDQVGLGAIKING